MASRSCVSGCGRFLTPSDGHDRCPSCLGFRHAEAALVDESCSHCGNMTMAMLRSRYLLARRGGVPLALPRSSSSGRRTTLAQGQGDLRITVRASPSMMSPRASHSSSTSHRLGFPDEYAGSSDRAGPSISFSAPADDGISITASWDELGSGEDDSAALPPSGRVALPESDPELTAMLSRAAESIGLHYRRPPSPERSRLDDWFLGAQAECRQPPPVPFFTEVHEEVTRSWKAPFSARNRPSASSVLTTLDGGAAQGYVEVPPVERAIAMQLCPQGAAAWRGNPRLPSRACKFSSALTAKAYGAAGQAASALHAMALQQVHQAKALKQLHEGDADPGVLQELRTATDLALRATKVTARAPDQTMSTLVVQERHLWLTLADMRESDKHRFLDSPISQVGLFGEAVEDFAQQFSAAQKQTEAFRHILPRRSAAVSTPPPAAAPPSARRRGRPPAASTSAPARPQQQPALRPQRGAGRRTLRRATRSLWILLFRRWWLHHSFPRRRAGWRIFCFLFVLFRHWPPGPTDPLGRDAEVLSGLPPAVVNTITSARALSTRQAYRLKWNLFVDWCSPRREDPRRCPIAVVLSFLQDGLEWRLSPSTLKVYVAAIAAHHDAVDGKSLGKHDLVIRFLRGARRLNPPRPHLVPSWDLPSVLSALRGAPFEPLQSVELKFLSLKTVLLSALATVKRVGDLQAFSVDDSCLEFGPADSHVVLRPRPGYVPKVPTMPFRDQVVNLQALPREEADPAIALLCPVRALRIYVDRTQSFRTSDQLFVCFGGQQKGRAVSKQRLAHWIVEAIVLAYQARRLPCPLGVRAHSTRGVASSWALARGASIADICKAAGWATPNTFARFYNLRIEPVSSRVLVSDGQ